MHAGLGLDLQALYDKGLDFMMQQAANWARIPTRLNRAEAARVIVEQAALQRGDMATVANMQTLRGAISNVRRMYDNGSAKVAAVVDGYRVLRPGQAPSLQLVGQAAESAAIVASTTATLTEVERGVAAAAQKVLTPQQQAQLNSGLSFPAFMGNQAKNVLKYILVGGGIYLAIRALGRAGGTRSW
jgi:hypothetical protein